MIQEFKNSVLLVLISYRPFPSDSNGGV